VLRTKYKDHALQGNWKGFRELHVQSDWLLIYKIDGKKLILTLVRAGSHDKIL
ncbi:type II toxin-antitoxin system YafQ family toxin, partial [Enterococcus hirae]